MHEVDDGASLQDLAYICPPPLIEPESSYSGSKPPYPQIPEVSIVDKLGDLSLQQYGDSINFLNLLLDQFSIYAEEKYTPHVSGLLPLNQIAVRQGNSTFFFDGVVNLPDSTKLYMRRVPFALVSIGGYEDLEQHTVSRDVWVQSQLFSGSSVWYQLGVPAPEYEEAHQLFIWVANLGKYVIDFMQNYPKVHLDLFRMDLMAWLLSLHAGDQDFVAWKNEYGRWDLREPVIANATYLLKQSLDINPQNSRHPLWDELGLSSQFDLVKRQPQSVTGTVVTPYVYDCFKNMKWGYQLTKVQLAPDVSKKREARIEKVNFNNAPRLSVTMESHNGCTSIEFNGLHITLGDVIAVSRDQETSWRNADNEWYAQVQDICPGKNNQPAQLFVIWLYRPSETICAHLTYPHKNELFLSDHCNCHDGPLYTSDIIRKIDVAFFSPRAKESGFFVRQIYSSEDQAFSNLKEEHFACACRKGEPEGPKYLVGDTVLVERQTDDGLFLQPAEITRTKPKNDEVDVCFFIRCHSPESNDCAPNELTYGTETATISMEQIERRCHIRIYTTAQKEQGEIPVPYSRNGTGDAFYVREDREETETSFKQGFDPLQPRKKLRGLNIFSGGGNFDRGIEEGGAVQSEWAVEWSLEAILTYRANHRTNAGDLKLFYGSVNDYLHSAIRGKVNPMVAEVGQVDFISAGSPCQGYSMANQQKQSEEALRNCSMIASVAAHIDFYRPKYAILENVVSMATKKGDNPLSQLVCCFVGMGYQVRVLNLDAWSFGAPQSRSRLFLVIAAPGLQLPDHPPLTHAHPPDTKTRGLGLAPNGQLFGKRRWNTPVFNYVPAVEATRDLPPIGMGRIGNIKYPDHRPIRIESPNIQRILNAIPRVPRKSGLRYALENHWIDPHQPSIPRRKGFAEQGKAYSRVDSHGLISTITTSPSVSCKFAGRWLHWQENRLLTILEARRAQGFPDEEVIIGTWRGKWKIVGNSVSRHVALALGLVIKDAVDENTYDDEDENAETITTPRPLNNSPNISGNVDANKDSFSVNNDSTTASSSSFLSPERIYNSATTSATEMDSDLSISHMKRPLDEDTNIHSSKRHKSTEVDGH